MSLIEDRLMTTLQNVNEHLRFAEAKNGALFAFAGAAVFALADKIAEQASLAVRAGLGVMLTACLFSLFFCLLAFVPQRTADRRSGDEPTAEDNLEFFEHLAKYEPELLIRAVCQDKKDCSTSDGCKHCRDIAHQIIINSRITVRKFELFNFAVCSLMYGIPVSVGAGLVITIGRVLMGLWGVR